MVTLSTLQDEGLFEPARPEFVAAPPRIAAPDARTRAVLGYLSTNCGSCHNEDSSIANLGLALKAKASPVRDVGGAGAGADVGVGAEVRAGQRGGRLQPARGSTDIKVGNPARAGSRKQVVTPGAPT